MKEYKTSNDSLFCGARFDFCIEQIMNWFTQLCGAVEFLHLRFEKPIIHRDIKPSNIVICADGNVKLIDFGIARSYDSGAPDQPDTQKFGTVGFAPPEQFGFKQTDERSDVYALGKILKYMLDSLVQAKTYPSAVTFSASDGSGVICKNTTDDARVQALQKVIEKACSFDPDNRYQSVRQLMDDVASTATTKAKAAPAYSKENTKNNPKAIDVLGTVWNMLLTCIFVLLECVTAFVVFDETEGAFIGHSLVYKSLVALCIMGFVYVPIYYCLLYKPRVRLIKAKWPKIFGWVPMLKWWQQIVLLFACFCVFLVLVLVAQKIIVV